jgi:hypothetical protein
LDQGQDPVGGTLDSGYVDPRTSDAAPVVEGV